MKQRKRKRRFLRLTLWALGLALVLSPFVLVYLAVEDTRLVAEAKSLDPEDASRAKQLLKSAWISVAHSERATTISASEADLNGLIALIARGLPNAVGRVNIAPWGLEGALSVQLPSNPAGQFLNVRIGLVPSSQGLNIAHATIGKLELPGYLATHILRMGLNIVLGDGEGTKVLGAVQSVSMSQETITLNVRPIPELKQTLERVAARAKVVRDDLALLGDPALVRVYYERCIEIGRNYRHQRSVSLARFTQPVFRLAEQRSGRSEVTEENQAAILALAMYLGDTRFEKFIGKVRIDALRAHQPLSDNVVLAGRHDLLLHFIISAGLQIISDRGVTHAIGEFKELLDSDRGGSGFSFVDLLADRTGVRFAEMATTEAGAAARMQRLLANGAREDVFFPPTTDLPEGISRAQFQEQLGNVESADYRAMVAEIDRRISALPVYSRQN